MLLRQHYICSNSFCQVIFVNTNCFCTYALFGVSAIKKIYIVIGCVTFALGTFGCVIPFLPTFPFFLVTCVCFAKGSDSLYDRFISSKLYKNNFKSLADGNGMRKKTKIRIILTVGACCAFGSFISDSITVRIILALVFLLHLLYFIFGIKNAGD